MNNFRPTEKKFEEHIENRLISAGYSSVHYNEYDRELCLIKAHAIEFIKKTQPEQWASLAEIYGSDVEQKILSRISSEITKRGIIDVLRKKVVDRGEHLELCCFEPKSALNPEHTKLYEANKFAVVRQLRYSCGNEKSIDMVLFLNGLPIVTMELKNQLSGQNIKDSERQYCNDRDSREKLLKFKRCLVHFCVDNDKVSMTTRLSGRQTKFLPYNRGLENPPVKTGYRTKYLWEDVLNPKSLLDIIDNFVHIYKEKEFFFNEKTQKHDMKKKDVLIFPRYHQRDLIHKFKQQLKKDGVGKNYLVQHTTGSGKSYSIGWLSHTLASFYQKKKNTMRMFDSIIVVSDRNVLDDQLRQTIKSLEQTDGVVNAVERGSKELRAFLEKGKTIIITTIQKFPNISEEISSLGHRKFGVIIDEVHSSQSGELSKELKKSLSKKGNIVDGEYDYEEIIRQEILSRGQQDHITFIGFTGTPKEKTLELFGTQDADGQFNPFHSYTMNQSIHEGFTLDVLQNYTTYKRYFKIKQIKKEEIMIPSSKGKREMIKFVDSHAMTIRYRVRIILDHWINKGSKEIQGRSRGMIVTQSRKHCVDYFTEINKQLEERGLGFRSLVAFSGEVRNKNKKYTEAELNKSLGYEGNVPTGLKNPKYRLLVVANKFQTGFDEPLMQSMYVVKKLSGVQCVQTLSRLNRTTHGKTQTFVLDFVNEPKDILEAFQRYYQSTILAEEADPNRLYDILREINDFELYTNVDVNQFCELFYDNNRDEGAFHPILDAAVDKFKALESDEAQERFRSKIQSYVRMYGYFSQIINFSDISLEKNFCFLKYLNKKLPKRDVGKLDISDTIDLDSLRIQKLHEQQNELINKDLIIAQPVSDGSQVFDPEYELVSEIIRQVNDNFGKNLTEADKVDLLRLYKSLNDNSVIEKFMTGDSTDENKKDYFRKQFDELMVENVNERIDFYKKIEDDQLMKDHIVQMMYANYKKNHRPLERR